MASFAWYCPEIILKTNKWNLVPYPCSHFYIDINFGDQLYSKEKRPGFSSSLLNIICRQIWYQCKSDYMDRAPGSICTALLEEFLSNQWNFNHSLFRKAHSENFVNVLFDNLWTIVGHSGLSAINWCVRNGFGVLCLARCNFSRLHLGSNHCKFLTCCN